MKKSSGIFVKINYKSEGRAEVPGPHKTRVACKGFCKYKAHCYAYKELKDRFNKECKAVACAAKQTACGDYKQNY